MHLPVLQRRGHVEKHQEVLRALVEAARGTQGIKAIRTQERVIARFNLNHTYIERSQGPTWLFILRGNRNNECSSLSRI
jgi:hypothetical protein